MTEAVSYSEGDWFAVPLARGGYALGLIARANVAGVLLGYFFGPKRDSMPTVDDIRQLGRDEAVWVQRFGHLGVLGGEWPVLGRTPAWNRSEWPMPAFRRIEELTGRSIRVEYSDEDPSTWLTSERVDPGAVVGLPDDGVAGAVYVQERLERLLGDSAE